VASGIIGTNNVNAVGGSASQYAGSGGVGRIAVYYAERFTGVTTPTAFIFNDTNSDTINITNQLASQSIVFGSNALFNVGLARRNETGSNKNSPFRSSLPMLASQAAAG